MSLRKDISKMINKANGGLSRNILFLVAIACVTMITSSCLKKQVSIDLPPFQSQLAIECYLGYPDTAGVADRGSAMKAENIHIEAAISNTQDYFAPINLSNLEVHNATVYVSYDSAGKTYADTLREDNSINLADTSNAKLYNYKSFKNNGYKIHYHTGLQYNLHIDDHKGHIVTANTQWLDTVHIENISTLFNSKDTTYSLIVHWQDASAGNDFYRLQVRILNMDSASVVKRGQPVKDDIALSDEGFNNGPMSIGTRFRFKQGDVIQAKLFHIRKEYYQYLRTVNLAESSMGNPFGQPAVIASNVTGGIGIFTPLPWTIQTFILH